MASIRFFIRGTKNPANIRVRLIDGIFIDQTASTGLSIDPKYWRNGKNGGIRQLGEFTDKLNLSNELEALKQTILQERNKVLLRSSSLNSDFLQKAIQSWKGLNCLEDSDFLIDRIEVYKQSLTSKVFNGKIGASDGTIRNYNTTIMRVKKYQDAKKRVLRLTDIDLNFHQQYIKFAQQVLGLSTNSIGKDLRNIKTVAGDSKENGFLVHDNVLSRSFKISTEKTLFTTLNESELNKLMEFDGPPYLVNARNWLIIGCWTGCRIGDLMKLSKDNIVIHTSGAQMIRYTQSKTGKTVNVPVHPHVYDILEECNGFPKQIHPVKMNLFIKEVCKRVGLNQKIYGTRQNPETHKKEVGYFEKWQLIKTHTCRRSFATNHYSKLTNKQIMAVTGHATENMLLKYIGEVEADHISDYVDLWNRESASAKAIEMRSQSA